MQGCVCVSSCICMYLQACGGVSRCVSVTMIRDVGCARVRVQVSLCVTFSLKDTELYMAGFSRMLCEGNTAR